MVKYLGSFQYPAMSQVFGIGDLEHIAHEGPVGEVGRLIAAHIAVIGIEPFGPLFAIPVIGFADADNTAAMCLDMVTGCIGPDSTGMDGCLFLCEADQWQDAK